MPRLEVGQKVTMAAMEQQVFTVTATNTDGSFTIETQLANHQKLTYDNVAFEMLRVLPSED